MLLDEHYRVIFGGFGAVAAAFWLDLVPSYVRDRFAVLFDHSYDTMKAGWQQTRSLLTLGGGGAEGFNHNVKEWYDPKGGYLGAQLAFLTSLLLVGMQGVADPLLPKRD